MYRVHAGVARGLSALARDPPPSSAEVAPSSAFDGSLLEVSRYLYLSKYWKRDEKGRRVVMERDQEGLEPRRKAETRHSRRGCFTSPHTPLHSKNRRQCGACLAHRSGLNRQTEWARTVSYDPQQQRLRKAPMYIHSRAMLSGAVSAAVRASRG